MTEQKTDQLMEEIFVNAFVIKDKLESKTFFRLNSFYTEMLDLI